MNETTQRLKQWIARLSLAGVIAAALLFVLDQVVGEVFGLDQLCSVEVKLLQPQLTDLCGTLSIGNRPTKIERIAWADRQPGSCEDLRRHVERFPSGVYRNKAGDLITARRVTQTETWTPGTRRLSLFVGQGDTPFSNEADARAAALARAQARAEQLCKGFSATTNFRFISARPVSQNWICEPVSGSVSCGLEGEVECSLEERHLQESETCGG